MKPLEYPDRNHFLTPSGTTISAFVVGASPVQGRDAEQVVLQVSSSGFASHYLPLPVQDDVNLAGLTGPVTKQRGLSLPYDRTVSHQNAVLGKLATQ